MFPGFRIEHWKRPKNCLKWLVNLLLILVAVRHTDTKAAGRHSCQRSWDGAIGICRPLSECPDIRAEGASNVRPDLCEFHGSMPIVCCVPKKRPSTEQLVQALSLSSFINEVSHREPIWRQKCREYSKLVFEAENPDSESKVARCAQATRKSVGRAAFGEFPHMAAIGYEPEDEPGFFDILCGGSLISERYVMTAAHCLVHIEPKWVLLGSLSLNRGTVRNLNKELNPISQVFVHPDNIKAGMYFDVGLVQLKSSPTLGPYLRPACLHMGKPTSTLELTVTGWGAPAYDTDASDALLKVFLVEAPFDECRAHYADVTTLYQGVHNASMICAGHPNNKADTCQGDSGGPLQIVSSDFYCMYEVVGIVSFGKRCGSGSPGVYSRVEYYRSWIEDIVWG